MYKFLFLFFSFFIFGQDLDKNKNIKVEYSFLYHKEYSEKKSDSLLKNNNSELSNRMSNNMKEAMLLSEKLLRFEMIATENESVFYRKKFLLNDDVNNSIKLFINYNNNFYFYRNKKENEIFSFMHTLNEDFLVDINNNDIVKYELTSESKIINNLECFKAKIINKGTNQVGFIVWYCPSINFNGGPQYCFDLPGLVLEINYPTYSIICKNIVFNLNDDEILNIKKPKGIKITEKELLDKQNEARASRNYSKKN
jgi:GLPGLI family protein